MKTIQIPIQVPSGDYCCNGPDLEICEHFDNEGGHPKCELGHVLEGYGFLTYDSKGQVKKLENCGGT